MRVKHKNRSQYKSLRRFQRFDRFSDFLISREKPIEIQPEEQLGQMISTLNFLSHTCQQLQQ